MSRFTVERDLPSRETQPARALLPTAPLTDTGPIDAEDAERINALVQELRSRLRPPEPEKPSRFRFW